MISGKIVKNVYQVGGRRASNDSPDAKKQRAREYRERLEDNITEAFCDNCGANLGGKTRVNCSECIEEIFMGNNGSSWCFCMKCYRDGSKCGEHPQSSLVVQQ